MWKISFTLGSWIIDSTRELSKDEQILPVISHYFPISTEHSKIYCQKFLHGIPIWTLVRFDLDPFSSLVCSAVVLSFSRFYSTKSHTQQPRYIVKHELNKHKTSLSSLKRLCGEKMMRKLVGWIECEKLFRTHNIQPFEVHWSLKLSLSLFFVPFFP